MKQFSLSVLLVIFLISCSASQPTKARSIEEDYLTHQVKYSGETLGTIASWYTGKTNNWKAIEAANSGLVVTKIRIGDKILIPRTLLRRTDPLPKTAIVVAEPIVPLVIQETEEFAIANPELDSEDVVAVDPLDEFIEERKEQELLPEESLPSENSENVESTLDELTAESLEIFPTPETVQPEVPQATESEVLEQF